MKLYAIFQSKSNISKLILFLLIFIFCSIIGSAIATLFFSSDLIIDQKLSQLIISTFIFIIPPLLFCYLEGVSILKGLGFANFFNPRMILLILVIMVFVLPFIAYSAQLNKEFIMFWPDSFANLRDSILQMEQRAIDITESFLKMDNIGDLMFNLFLIALVPAIGEEMVFRGFLQKKLYLVIRNPHIAILASSFIFSAIHMQFLTFLPRLLLGILLGYLFYYSCNLWMSVIAHFINNGIAIVLHYYLFANRVDLDIVSGDTEVSGVFGLMSACIVLMFLYLYKQISPVPPKKIN